MARIIQLWRIGVGQNPMRVRVPRDARGTRLRHRTTWSGPRASRHLTTRVTGIGNPPAARRRRRRLSGAKAVISARADRRSPRLPVQMTSSCGPSSCPTGRCSSRTHTRPLASWLVPRRRGLRPRLLAAVVRSNATLAFAAERQVVGRTSAVPNRRMIALRRAVIRPPPAAMSTNASLRDVGPRVAGLMLVTRTIASGTPLLLCAVVSIFSCGWRESRALLSDGSILSTTGQIRFSSYTVRRSPRSS